MSENLTVADVLERAADLIEPEGRWTQDAYAKRADGSTTRTHSADAVCFCLVGALATVAEGLGDPRVNDAAGRLFDVIGGSVTAFNDAPERTQAEVVAKLREAAALARGQGK